MNSQEELEEFYNDRDLWMADKKDREGCGGTLVFAIVFMLIVLASTGILKC